MSITYLSWPLVVGLMFVFGLLRRKRSRVYATLVQEQQQLIKRKTRDWDEWLVYPKVLPSFARGIVSLPEILTTSCLDQVRFLTQGIRRNERSYIPTHKQGGTISYEHLHACAPDLVAFYQSPRLHELISSLVGERVVPTPLHDQSSCSLLVYERPSDHIGWHFDHNFYSGRHFTVLLSIINEDFQHGGLSSACLQARINGEVEEIPTPPNTLVLFEGAHLMHRATKLGPNQKRVLLSMTFCTNAHAPWYRAVMRRCKDTAYYGIRALWT